MKTKIIKQKSIFFFCLILLYIIYNKYYKAELERNILDKTSIFLKINRFEEMFNNSIKKSTVLIFEPNRYHFECLPGYAKYFIDLGYNVDILSRNFGIDSFYLFKEKNKIRYFVYVDLTQFSKYYKNFISYIKNYDFIVIQSINEQNKKLLNRLKFLKLNNTIFIFHNIVYANRDYSIFFIKKRIWTLGNISKGLQVNPHYFGYIKIKDKTGKTIFFLTSTVHRNYNYFIKSLLKLKEDNLNFEIIVTGAKSFFNSSIIPKNLIHNFSFKYSICYEELYKAIIKSDFIILPFDPKKDIDKTYKSIRVSGSIQLAYGFLKPVIIDLNFADFYKLNNKNSLIYENYDFYTIMKKAIKLNDKEYKYLQSNLKDTVQEIYKISINNVKKTINEIKK